MKPNERLVTATQVHKADVVTVSREKDGQRPTADALVTAEPGLMIGVHTADCLPVILIDPACPAVATLHAGWRPIAAGIIEAGIGALQKMNPAALQGLIVFFGPSIRGCCYEVDDPVVSALERSSVGRAGISPGRRAGHVQLDLVDHVTHRLLAAQVRARAIEPLSPCTRCHSETYFSYRREGPGCGSLFSFAVISAVG